MTNPKTAKRIIAYTEVLKGFTFGIACYTFLGLNMGSGFYGLKTGYGLGEDFFLENLTGDG